jgi:hypothetical protein
MAAIILVSKVFKDTYLCVPYCPSRCGLSKHDFILIQISPSMSNTWPIDDGNSKAVDSTNETRANLEECNAEENRGMNFHFSKLQSKQKITICHVLSTELNGIANQNYLFLSLFFISRYKSWTNLPGFTLLPLIFPTLN